ncbi:anthranilate synthase component II [Pectinatus haikarae]|uniref:Anthranilate synthase component 2 n=1 Tax=Pectinatus haikarae TaxID=349096 RepID=A0ABT9YB56_9FIRM|nr:aminodeoxychorismate/anthranilate synthase component II [Pectinatus haikarae]MDQ0205075.1 anthranilate synthase component 2 [Pectinatus haikarae]
MLLLIDNYDSFSYNLYQLLGEIDADIKVIRNDELTVEEIRALSPARIVLSPGPGRPEDAGICKDVVRALGSKIPILGVCLGHQAIGEVFSATVGYAKKIMHGKKSMITVTGNMPIFKGMPEKFEAARYHSLAVDRNTITDELIVTAQTDDGEVMAMRHRDYPIYGVQFHPESILTFGGKCILQNFLQTGGAVQ